MKPFIPRRGIDWFSAVSFVAGGGLTSIFAPPNVPLAARIGLDLMAVAGLVRVVFNPTGAPATSIVAGADVISPHTKEAIATITPHTQPKT